ncbi:MAG: hypothetical protein IJ113_08485 [Eggerthellaceae bacterium]|nr:hypothetical protein [Eggerthellaceae bacterium]
MGKGELSEEALTYYLYKDGNWVEDTGFVISDLLHGFDPSEPAGSPYAYGSMDIMREVKKISAEEAMERIESGNYNEPDKLPTKPAQAPKEQEPPSKDLIPPSAGKKASPLAGKRVNLLIPDWIKAEQKKYASAFLTFLFILTMFGTQDKTLREFFTLDDNDWTEEDTLYSIEKFREHGIIK